jgi:DnaJ-class molecular chaperone
MEIGISEVFVVVSIILIAYNLNRHYFRKGNRDYSGRRDEQENRNGRKNQPTVEAEQDPYTILRIDRNATREELGLAYRKLAKMYHPDKVAGLAPEYREIAEKKMKMINAAYRRLMDTVKS